MHMPSSNLNLKLSKASFYSKQSERPYVFNFTYSYMASGCLNDVRNHKINNGQINSICLEMAKQQAFETLQ